MSATTFRNVTCTGCGCACDDLSLTVAENRIRAVENGCSLVNEGFLAQPATGPDLARIRGAAATREAAIAHAIELLKNARQPLVFGLSRSSTEGQRAAIALADELGACIDTTASLGHGSSILALQQVGESTCSLGEIRQRADLILYFGSDPETTHPRHRERYAIPPGTEHQRHLVVIDSERTATAKLAQTFLQIPPQRFFETIQVLRAFVRGVLIHEAAVRDLPLQELRELAERMTHCRCGVVFFGYGVSRQAMGHRQVEILLRLVTELNRFTVFHARRMRVAGDVTGADSVLCWQTGYPFSVSLSRGTPRYSPGEFSAGELLARREVDAAILVGSDHVRLMSDETRDWLTQIPTIVLDSPQVAPPFPPTVHFTTAVYGIHAPGTIYRMDEVPLPLTAVLATHLPTDADILEELHKGWGRENSP